MKTLVILVSLILGSTAYAASKDNPVFTQCTVDIPGSGNIGGICRDTGEKHYAFITCEGEILAFVEPGALDRVDGITCGTKHYGYDKVPKKN